MMKCFIICLSKKSEGIKMGTIVQHDGEYVLTSSGSMDFGEITAEMAIIIKRQAGKIRLRIGIEKKGYKGNFGESHIQRPARLEQIQSAGFECARGGPRKTDHKSYADHECELSAALEPRYLQTKPGPSRERVV